MDIDALMTEQAQQRIDAAFARLFDRDPALIYVLKTIPRRAAPGVDGLAIQPDHSAIHFSPSAVVNLSDEALDQALLGMGETLRAHRPRTR